MGDDVELGGPRGGGGEGARRHMGGSVNVFASSECCVAIRPHDSHMISQTSPKKPASKLLKQAGFNQGDAALVSRGDGVGLILDHLDRACHLMGLSFHAVPASRRCVVFGPRPLLGELGCKDVNLLDEGWPCEQRSLLRQERATDCKERLPSFLI